MSLLDLYDDLLNLIYTHERHKKKEKKIEKGQVSGSHKATAGPIEPTTLV